METVFGFLEANPYILLFLVVGMAATSGAYTPPPGVTPEEVSSMIALSYGVTYIWGTVGIILICKSLPRWWGVDARAAGRQYENQFGVRGLS